MINFAGLNLILMKLTFLGHAGFQLETKGCTIVFDPFISPNPAASNIDVDAIECDFLVLTHGHADHVADVEKIASNNPNLTLISNYEVATFYGSKGINGHGMNHGGKFQFKFGTLKLVNAVHSSSFPDGSYAGNPAGVVIWNDEGCLYHAGDTALTRDMELIPMTCPPVHICILPIGDNFTMGYEDALIAAQMVSCNFIVACHFNTFPAIEVNESLVRNHFESNNKRIVIPAIGQTIQL